MVLQTQLCFPFQTQSPLVKQKYYQNCEIRNTNNRPQFKPQIKTLDKQTNEQTFSPLLSKCIIFGNVCEKCSWRLQLVGFCENLVF